MMSQADWLGQFRAIWLVDFEFRQSDGGLPEPHCMVAREFSSGRTLRLWRDELLLHKLPPFAIDSNALFVAYTASAELNCFRVLGWSMPQRILDLYPEFRLLTNNGRQLPHGKGLLGALKYFGLTGIDATKKETMRELAIRGAPFTNQEQSDLLDYCESDVIAIAQLLPVMAPKIDHPRALLRGRYMAAVSAMETTGTPIDTRTLSRLLRHWNQLQLRLIDKIDARYGVYENRTFKVAKFEDWLKRNGIPWQRLESGQLSLDRDTFRQAAKTYPQVAPLCELRNTLSDLKNIGLTVGDDGRNRCMLSPFASKTGRNQPSTTKFIFGLSTWLRGLIKPAEGMSVAYIDYSQQEFAIAGVLSGDDAMIAAYKSGDPYLAFAKQAGVVPADATKESHASERALYKQCALAVQYGMGDVSLARQLGKPGIVGRQLLQQHHETYPKFWKWSDNVTNRGLLGGSLSTPFGWKHHYDPQVKQNPRSLANFPVQATGADILRVACCLATERGIHVCCPVHDAILVEASSASIDAVVAQTQECLAEASRSVLAGFELRSDVEVVNYPARYMDERGVVMWDEAMRLLDEIEESPPL